MDIYSESGEFVLTGDELLKLLNDVQEKGGSLRFKAKGYSMKPSIRNNDIIKVSRVSPQGISKGDIVLYRKNPDSQVVVHRIIKKKGQRFLLRGDNQYESDGWIEQDMIHGVVDAVTRNGKPVNVLTTSGNNILNSIHFFFYNFYLVIRRRAAGIVFKMRKRS